MKIGNTEKQIVVLLILLASTGGQTSSPKVVKLPYEIENTIIDVTDPSEYIQGLDRVNISNANITRPIYRKDLDANYIAYYEIEAEGKYIILSAGPETGDYREAESGPSPRPTDTLIGQARKHGQECSKFYRLSPFGLSICENEERKAVAATFNWTSDDTKISDWRKLDAMVRLDLNYIAETWRGWAAEVRKTSEWKTTDVLDKNKVSTATEEEAVAIGAVVKLALEEDLMKVAIFARDIGSNGFSKTSSGKWQSRLCQVLVNVCSGTGTVVNKELIKRTNNGLPYLQLEVHNNRNRVQRILQNKELGFIIVITSQKGETVVKHYAIELPSSRKRQWPPGSYTSLWKQWEIPREELFPEYDQHDCCGCKSGCTPVAWAQIFAYYDRLAHSSMNYGHNKGLFRCGGTRWGSSYCKAPKRLDSSVKTFVEDIRKELKTKCSGGQGSTRWRNVGRVLRWYRERQGKSARVENFPSWIGKRSSSTDGFITVWGKVGRIRDKAIAVLKGYPAYPAQVSIKVAFSGGKKGGHSAVVTKYRERHRRYRSRHCREIHMRMGGRPKCKYDWYTQYDRQFYYHMGWGGTGNAWHKALASTVSIAKPY